MLWITSRRGAADARLSEEERRRSETDALKEKLTRVERKNTEVYLFIGVRSRERWMDCLSPAPLCLHVCVCDCVSQLPCDLVMTQSVVRKSSHRD